MTLSSVPTESTGYHLSGLTQGTSYKIYYSLEVGGASTTIADVAFTTTATSASLGISATARASSGQDFIDISKFGGTPTHYYLLRVANAPPIDLSEGAPAKTAEDITTDSNVRKETSFTLGFASLRHYYIYYYYIVATIEASGSITSYSNVYVVKTEQPDGPNPSLSFSTTLTFDTSNSKYVNTFRPNKRGYIHYMVTLGGATPTKAEIQAGTGAVNNVLGVIDNIDDPAIANMGVDIPGDAFAQDGTAYTIHHVFRDEGGKLSAIYKTDFNAHDSTPPPALTNLRITKNVDGIAHKMLVTFSNTEAGTTVYANVWHTAATTSARDIKVQVTNNVARTQVVATKSNLIVGDNSVELENVELYRAQKIMLAVEDGAGNLQPTVLESDNFTLEVSEPTPILYDLYIGDLSGSNFRSGTLYLRSQKAGTIYYKDEVGQSLVHSFFKRSASTQVVSADKVNEPLSINFTAAGIGKITYFFEDSGGVPTRFRQHPLVVGAGANTDPRMGIGISSLAATGFTLTFAGSKTGTVHYAVLPAATSAPSNLTGLKAATGAANAVYGTAHAQGTANITGLAAGTKHKIYYSLATATADSGVGSLAFTTPAAAATVPEFTITLAALIQGETPTIRITVIATANAPSGSTVDLSLIHI